MLLLLGVEAMDDQSDIDYLVHKLARLRIFNDASGVMNLNVCQVSGEILVVSQFTLYASTRKGNRPSYVRAAVGEISQPLYNTFVETLRTASNCPVYTGVFGADMQVHLTNDGPVTIWIDSKNRE
jgi:D-tyrosyl-tRNA(Tyr) deacylase